MRSILPRAFWAAGVAIFGLIYGTKLDGQTFTNGLVCVGCLAVSVGICFWTIFDRALPLAMRVLASVFAGLLLTALIAVAIDLPSAYRFQERFNTKVQETFEKVRREIGGQEPRP